ncbi:hypothetical protein H072_1132 [Dactylellina haptotyla CBS 200.50]|uniref:Uncharacterized protein n=1 Tax=Dactylellina haptotyla (strain CBS 200.50) TaxID=1284197 RepID=S8AVA6_DACHA|nr:hypothetical protein H072_1132 [Dactylellina haptotyla CBS 200.50]
MCAQSQASRSSAALLLGPQAVDENGRRDEKGDDEERLGPWVASKTPPSSLGAHLGPPAEISRDRSPMQQAIRGIPLYGLALFLVLVPYILGKQDNSNQSPVRHQD